MNAMRRDMYEEIFQMLRYCGEQKLQGRTVAEKQALIEWIHLHAKEWRTKKEKITGLAISTSGFDHTCLAA